ncbi:MAG: hypothetical protein ACQESP_05375 [Candidatus Muiribacteriota bacterium]
MHKIKFFILYLLIFQIILFPLSERITYIEEKTVNDYPSMSLEEANSKLNHSNKIKTATYLKKVISSYFPPDFREQYSYYISCFEDSEYKQYLNNISDILTNKNKMQLAGIIERLDKHELIKIKPVIFEKYHESISMNFRAAFHQIKESPGFIKKNYNTITDFQFIKNVSEEDEEKSILESTFAQITKGNIMQLGKLKEVAEFPSNTIKNSINLAKVLNQLSNYNTNSRNYKKIKFTYNENTYTLEKPADLIDVLFEIDELEVLVYESRSALDYAKLALKSGFSYHPIEIPVLVETRSNDDFLYFPAIKSAYILAVYKKGEKKPLSLINWNIESFNDKDESAASWKEAVYVRPSWTGFKITDKISDKSDLEDIIIGSHYLMKFYNFVQSRYLFLKNGYGVLSVNNDAVSILSAYIQREADLAPFPNLRNIKYDYLYHSLLSNFKKTLKLDDNNILNVPSDIYRKHFISSNPQVNRDRLAKNFPFRKKSDISNIIYKNLINKLLELYPDFEEIIK